ncbi:hypothetical protein N7466_006167 [Penicillium verhagenii]|uniref:uncharacterized protein n=1 Tax=Penicillium verhagenii TaxID=1562060 RepID=UPI0025458F0B|nr:uncharacterized protein N7466_006167 [Penicillium verhagenii]KAJ5930674.1 hypothetical protein N7466_006167 [Penicillium verhagenii]
MASFPFAFDRTVNVPQARAFYTAATEADKITEAIWHDSAANGALYGSNLAVFVPFNLAAKIGDDNMTKLANRLSVLISVAVHVVKDESISAFRICPVPEVNPNDIGFEHYSQVAVKVKDALKNGQITAPGKKEKAKHVPRPPNAWILYRQNHHAVTTSLYPDLPNTEISKIIANQWKNEPSNTRQMWQNMANRAKAQHALENPSYRYTPRRPGEKMTRRTRLPISAVSDIARTRRGFQRLEDAKTGGGTNPHDSHNQLDVDQELIEMINGNSMMHGPDGILNDYPLSNDFADMIDAQINRLPIEPANPDVEEESPFSQAEMDAFLNLH